MAQPKNPEVIQRLNEILTAELTAINQYFLHAKILQDMGLESLYAYVYKESIDEMKHAEMIIDRVLYLDGLPNLQKLNKLRVGETVTEMMKADLALEDEAIPRLNEAVAFCQQQGDNGTRALLERILESEEEHRDWLTSQLDLIERIGEAAYCAEHIRA